jgi:hypothetical protein
MAGRYYLCIVSACSLSAMAEMAGTYSEVVIGGECVLVFRHPALDSY